MRKLIFCLAAVTIASAPAAAQVNTDCSWFGNTWQCRSYDPNANSNDWASALRSMAEANREEAKQQALLEAELARLAALRELSRQQDAYLAQQARAEKEEQSFLGLISILVNSGMCDAARDEALRRGRLEVADQAVRVCKTKAPPKKKKK